MVEVSVARLGIDSTSNSYVVILRERGGTRLLPIWIGKPEAESIAMQMNDYKRERPITHDLCKSVIVALGGTLQRVNITRMEKSTYFAEMALQGSSGVVRVDARPSDAIAIALRFDAPIFAPDDLLTEMASDEGDASDADDAFLTPPASDELSPEQLKTYLEGLRPEDFGRFNP